MLLAAIAASSRRLPRRLATLANCLAETPAKCTSDCASFSTTVNTKPQKLTRQSAPTSSSKTKNTENNPYTLPNNSSAAAAINSYTNRTHSCGELNLSNVGETVQLCGWLQFQRMRMFLTLRDGYGETQIVIPDNLIDSIRLDSIPFESILSIRGRVVPRPAAQQNARMPTGEIEVQLSELRILNGARSNLPMEVRSHNRAGEAVRLEHRYLDLRFADMQRNLRQRSQLVHRMRRFLIEEAGFCEVETPTLFRRTPGGAQEFVVPTRRPGLFYSLVQSPQQFKQMLMSGAIDRYFQVARCYRDESTRPDRQPEFTQLDVELSFVERDGVMQLVEDLLLYCWPQISQTVQLHVPFKRITYAEAMSTYGSDKPDTRFGLHIERVLNGSARAICVPANTRGKPSPSLAECIAKADCAGVQMLQINREPDVWCNYNKVDGFTSAELKEICDQLNVQRNWTVLLARTGESLPNADDVLTSLGRARLIAQDFLEANQLVDQPRSVCAPFDFLWVIDFPLFAAPPTAGDALETVHHPFTAPHPDDVALLDDVAAHTRIRSQAYDLVLNGQEVGGGSIRIHDAALQRRVLDDILRINHEHLSHLLDALATGCPPHGGIALGVDRLLAIVCGARSIRDVIAFPKGADGRDALSKAPVRIADAELELYHINVRE